MGCDIHLYVEVNKNGFWLSADSDDYFYHDRNYTLFSILADVRNSRNPELKSISEPRGIPSDCSPEVKSIIKRWDCDGHSHSHFTAAELMAFDWTQKHPFKGFVNGPEFLDWQRTKRWQYPESWLGICPPGRQELTSEEMDKRCEEISKECSEPGVSYPDRNKFDAAVKAQLGDTYCVIKWEMPYFDMAKDFLGKTLPKLWRLGKPEDVRIVFFFDN